MRILITGGAGFIGSHVIENLLSSNHSVYIHKSENTNIKRINNRITEKKVKASQDLDEIFHEFSPEVVIHLATKYVKTEEKEDISSLISTNIEYLTQLCELSKRNQVKLFINTGTFFEYKLNGGRKMDEEAEEMAYNLYAATKLAGLEILRYYSGSCQTKFITLRLFSPYGENDNLKIIKLLIESIFTGNKVTLNNYDQKLSFTYVGDIARAYVNCIKYIDRLPKFLIINIGHEKSYTVKEIVEIISKLGYGFPNVEYGENTNNIGVDTIFHSKYAFEYLDWKAEIGIVEGLNKTIIHEYQLRTDKN